MNTPEPQYQIAPLTMMELVAIRVALKQDICRFFKWRHDAKWRQTIRECIAAYRKTERMEVTI
jgi:hypothetical protein